MFFNLDWTNFIKDLNQDIWKWLRWIIKIITEAIGVLLNDAYQNNIFLLLI